MDMWRGTFGVAWLGLFGAGLVAPAAPAAADVIEIVQSPSDVANGISYPRVRVDGQGTDRYDTVATKTVEAWFTISGHTPKNGTSSSGGEIRVEGDRTPISRPGKAAVYKVSFPYVDPRSASVANVRISPVKLCNDRLATLQGAARAAFLKEGGNLNYPNAWSASASIDWRFFYVAQGHKNRTFNAVPAPVGAIIECLALERPKVRTQSQTQGVPGRPGKRMEPTIQSATLRMEPARIERVGGDLCPTQLRLYGQVVAIREFQGSAIIFGPGFLTPVTPLNFATAGTRAVLGTYKLNWGGTASSSLSAGRSAPKSQSVSLTMNVASSENRILEQARETVTVTCKRALPARAVRPDRRR
ncbi:MAG TPA: hypothetical protein VGR05_08065 [Sphingomicrobium sp.]|nr:hypothetical protein [Sphingomicrobium sp.]